MLFANLEEPLRRAIIHIYRISREFIRPLKDANKYLSLSYPNHSYHNFLENIIYQIQKHITIPIINYFEGINILDPRKWLAQIRDLFINILTIQYRPVYDKINQQFHKSPEKEISNILRCNARLIYDFHLI